MENYIIELVWNREFNWAFYKSSEDKDQAIKSAKIIRDSGDGARVKKVRVVNQDNGEVVWSWG